MGKAVLLDQEAVAVVEVEVAATDGKKNLKLLVTL
jgi:hypothetical protein